MGNEANGKTTMSKLGSVVVNMLIRFIRCIIDNTIHGIMAVMYSRSPKKKIPRITNDLLLEPAMQLASKIRRGELSSETLVRTYIKRINEVNNIINAAVDCRYVDALEEARQVDELVRSGTLSERQMAEDLPLLGIPFTAKESLLVKGLSSTGGLFCRKGFTASEDSEPVQVIRSCGAIPVAVTLIPELSLWWESYNKLHGRAKNPYDIRRTPGGSSGGEGALIASAGSVIGLGTDLGGSIRRPAFFNGIFGHKPTQGTVPDGGQYPIVTKEVGQYCVVGPMTRYAVDLKLVLSCLVGKDETEKLKLFNPIDVKSIKVYYMLDNGGDPKTTPVSSDVRNGIKRVVEMLSTDGFTVRKANLQHLKNGFNVWSSTMMTVRDQKLSVFLQEETRTKEKHFLLRESLKWVFGRSNHVISILLFAFFGDVIQPFFPKRLEIFKEYGVKMKQELLGLLEPEPAVFLYPTFPQVSPYLGEILFKLYNLGYTMIFNAAALPVTQCPLGLDSSGLPFGMQIVTAPNNDRLSIAIAEYVEEKLGGWIQPT